MKLNHFDNAKQFYERVKSYLLQHEAHHNLQFGMIDAPIRSPERFASRPYLVAVQEDETLLAVVLQTPPQKLVLSRVLNFEALNAIAQDFHSRQEQLPGVIGLTAEAKAFAEAWRSLTGQSYREYMAQRIYQLEAVQPISRASGNFRRATTDDRDCSIGWSKAFMEEIGDDADERAAERIIDYRLSEGTLYV
jgi:hypothetical protein